MTIQKRFEPLYCIYEITSNNFKAITDFAEFLLEMIQNTNIIHGETISHVASYNDVVVIVAMSTRTVIGDCQAWKRLAKTFDPALQLTCRYIKLTKRQYIVIHENSPQKEDRADWILAKIRSDSGISKKVRHANALELFTQTHARVNFLHMQLNQDNAENEWIYLPPLPLSADDILDLDVIMPVVCTEEVIGSVPKQKDQKKENKDDSE